MSEQPVETKILQHLKSNPSGVALDTLAGAVGASSDAVEDAVSGLMATSCVKCNASEPVIVTITDAGLARC